MFCIKNTNNMENTNIMTEEQIIQEELIEVGLAKEFKESVTSSPVLQFDDIELREKIMSSDNDQLLVVTSTIDSPKTVKSVEYYDREFLMKVL